MDITIITNFIVENIDVLIVILCYLLGNAIKKCEKIDNEYIMIINALCGVAMAVCLNGFACNIEVIKTGVCSGLFATVVHEGIKNGLSLLNRA
ncbi:MAG: hypothetical protein IKU47_03305 [Oscillospiraceae bacterium]|nr:hypothetical protein [Oscillospiraceae bacterium]